MSEECLFKASSKKKGLFDTAASQDEGYEYNE